MDLILDVNTQIYPVDLGMTFCHIVVRLYEDVIQGHLAMLLAASFFVSCRIITFITVYRVGLKLRLFIVAITLSTADQPA